MIIGILTNAGERRIRKYIQDNPDHDLYIGWGYCLTTKTATATDTALVKEYGRAKATISIRTSTYTGDTLRVYISEVVNSINGGGESKNYTGCHVQEVGIFDAASGGNMLYRGLLSEDSTTPKSRWLEDGDTLEVTIDLHLAAGEFV
jgi:hypothetical protein